MNDLADPRPVDYTDWLKTAAIILVAVDHFGYFFIDDAGWWNALGRMAAPPFFFLLGYAVTRAVPFRWIWLGVFLTVLDSSNNEWEWMAPNILLSLALIRFARPGVQNLLLGYGWAAYAVLVAVLFGLLPVASEVVEYGSAGWLWALLGLLQRMVVDGKSSAGPGSSAGHIRGADKMRLLTCFIASLVWIWQEQIAFEFTTPQLATVIAGIGIMTVWLFSFRRGPSHIQPPEPLAGTLRFIGRHTLEIYAIQLAASELIIKFWPGLAA